MLIHKYCFLSIGVIKPERDQVTTIAHFFPSTKTINNKEIIYYVREVFRQHAFPNDIISDIVHNSFLFYKKEYTPLVKMSFYTQL